MNTLSYLILVLILIFLASNRLFKYNKIKNKGVKTSAKVLDVKKKSNFLNDKIFKTYHYRYKLEFKDCLGNRLRANYDFHNLFFKVDKRPRYKIGDKLNLKYDRDDLSHVLIVDKPDGYDKGIELFLLAGLISLLPLIKFFIG